MEWQIVGSITTTKDYAFTPVVTGTLFKLKHTSAIANKSDLKIVIRQAFENEGQLALFDYKLINCKVEQDIILFSLPKGLTSRKLAIKRVDNLSDSWIIEIESLNVPNASNDIPVKLNDLLEFQQLLLSNLNRLESETDENVLVGTPLYIKQNGKLGIAYAGTSTTSRIVGLSLKATNIGYVCTYVDYGNVSQSDWSDIIGYATFRVGEIYYLDTLNVGNLTHIPPESGYLIEVGRAITPYTIALNIKQSILL